MTPYPLPTELIWEIFSHINDKATLKSVRLLGRGLDATILNRLFEGRRCILNPTGLTALSDLSISKLASSVQNLTVEIHIPPSGLEASEDQVLQDAEASFYTRNPSALGLCLLRFQSVRSLTFVDPTGSKSIRRWSHFNYSFEDGLRQFVIAVANFAHLVPTLKTVCVRYTDDGFENHFWSTMEAIRLQDPTEWTLPKQIKHLQLLAGPDVASDLIDRLSQMQANYLTTLFPALTTMEWRPKRGRLFKQPTQPMRLQRLNLTNVWAGAADLASLIDLNTPTLQELTFADCTLAGNRPWTVVLDQILRSTRLTKLQIAGFCTWNGRSLSCKTLRQQAPVGFLGSPFWADHHALREAYIPVARNQESAGLLDGNDPGEAQQWYIANMLSRREYDTSPVYEWRRRQDDSEQWVHQAALGNGCNLDFWTAVASTLSIDDFKNLVGGQREGESDFQWYRRQHWVRG